MINKNKYGFLGFKIEEWKKKKKKIGLKNKLMNILH